MESSIHYCCSNGCGHTETVFDFDDERSNELKVDSTCPECGNGELIECKEFDKEVVNLIRKSTELNLVFSKTEESEFNLNLLDHGALILSGGKNSASEAKLLATVVESMSNYGADELLFHLMIDDNKREKYAHSIPFPDNSFSSTYAAIALLEQLQLQVKERYALMHSAGCCNIVKYNKKAKFRLPTIVFMIDELSAFLPREEADYKTLEQLIFKINQTGRAAGVILILKTSRPSVNVLTGLILASAPNRVAWKAETQLDMSLILSILEGEKPHLLENELILSLAGKEELTRLSF